jgi:hypothetical protein
MDNDQDLKALMSSEVFRNYLSLEMEREAKAKLPNEEQIKISQRKAKEASEALTAFAQFETQVKENFLLKEAFLNMQKEISNNPALAQKLGKKFTDAIMMLDLDSTF